MENIRGIRFPKIISPSDALCSRTNNVAKALFMFLLRASKMLSGRLDEASGCDMVHVAIWGFGRGVVVSEKEN